MTISGDSGILSDVEKDKKGAANKHKNGVGAEFSASRCRFFQAACGLVGLFCGLRVKKTAAFRQMKKSGAMLVMVNHLSPYDMLAFCPPLYPSKTNFVVAQNMLYSNRFFSSVISKYHAITKRQYFADLRCVMSIKRYLDAGVNVLICPEGKVAADGSTGVIPQSAAKLIKWLKYPVASITLSGTGLMRPKWASNARLGRIEAHCDALFTVEQIESLSKQQINDALADALRHDEHVWQAENNVHFYGSHYAEGLQKILYRCPECGQEFKMTAKGNKLKCAACGNTVKYKTNGQLVAVDGGHAEYDRIDKWYEYERNCIKRQLNEPNFTLKEAVELFVEKNGASGYRLVAMGDLTLDRTALTFKASSAYRPTGVKTAFKVNAMSVNLSSADGSEPVEEEFLNLSFNLCSFDTVANMPGTSLDLYDDKHLYRFMFTERLAATKFALAIEQIAIDRHALDEVKDGDK